METHERAVVYETRDLGIKLFEEQVKVDLSVVCFQDVAKHE